MGVLKSLLAWLRTAGTRCEYCRANGATYFSPGGYRYCSAKCQAADADSWSDLA